MEDKNNGSEKSYLPVDTTPKVIGIGGIFFLSDDLKKVKEWYTKNLGIEINDWGSSSFESRNVNKLEEINSLPKFLVYHSFTSFRLSERKKIPPIPITFGVASAGEFDFSDSFFLSSIVYVFFGCKII